jgi:type II secretory ATPase GspE/PulE/Tfp pilus assembly ATPase PilB-like protein
MVKRPDREVQEFVDEVLERAVDERSSDIYWLPSADRMIIRFRKDGKQRRFTDVPPEYGRQCVARLKVLSGLLTYKTRVSQDGVLRHPEHNNGCEMRISIMPANHGQRAAIRILGNRNRPTELEDLGFPRLATEAVKQMLCKGSGMIVLTGPTGSGKTTTIYALVRELIRQQHDPASIITIEDPIECEIDGITQTAVSEPDDWNYAAALRAALRQDVKTIVVGEMRDKEVVRVTLDAALTGHRVITTYHAGDIPSVYARMLHQGFEPFLIASAVSGVINQRLVQQADRGGLMPAVSFLVADDEWRDFVTASPGLSELRKKVKTMPDASLASVARRMFDECLIPKEQFYLLSGDSA